MEKLNWLVVVGGILLVVACGVSGSLVLLYRGRQMRLQERQYAISTPYLQHIAGGIGAAMGLAIGGVVFYYLSLNKQATLIEWIGRFSYILVAAASGGHLLVLVTTALNLMREEQAWKNKRGPGRNTLGRRRLEAYGNMEGEQGRYLDLKSLDEAVVDELIGVLGNALLGARRNLVRLPFYGYLGTVCGILLMAEELSKINEATETFKVLSSMAQGLVLAFQTTLIALLAYLPLRKVADCLMQRLAALEDDWSRLRDECGDMSG